MTSKRLIAQVGPEMEGLYVDVRHPFAPVLAELNPELAELMSIAIQNGKDIKSVLTSKGSSVKVPNHNGKPISLGKLFKSNAPSPDKRFLLNYQASQAKTRTRVHTAISSFKVAIRSAISSGYLPFIDEDIISSLDRLSVECVSANLLQAEAMYISFLAAIGVSYDALSYSQEEYERIVYHEFFHAVSGKAIFAEASTVDGELEMGVFKIGVSFVLPSSDDEIEPTGQFSWLDEAITDSLANYLQSTNGVSPIELDRVLEKDDNYYLNKKGLVKIIKQFMTEYEILEQEAWEIILAAYFEHFNKKSKTEFKGKKYSTAFARFSHLFGLAFKSRTLLKELENEDELLRFIENT